MSDDFDPEFKNLLRRLIREHLIKEIVDGRSWRKALQNLQDIFDVDEIELESQAAQIIESDREGIADDSFDPAVIDLAEAREQRKNDKPNKAKIKDKSKDKDKKNANASGPGFYGAAVRDQVFEVIVRQGLAGAAWRTICAGTNGY